ncbi:MAG: homocysteine S-methyltransferase [Ardenticatenaceae bacterium]
MSHSKSDVRNSTSPIVPFLEQQGVLILDGGLATELETRGHDLRDPLWSAKLLLSVPEAIQEVHFDYLQAGADCVISASYQATIAAFMQRGMSEAQAIDLLQLSVQLAVAARDDFWRRAENQHARLRPIVAASIGPYGAYLADGSEYSGTYGLTEEALIAFHRRRWHILATTEADLLACETIPSHVEAQALARLLIETPQRYAWFSFSCRDEKHINDGTPIADVVAPLAEMTQVAAFGVNCTPPHYLLGLIAEIRRVTDKPIVVYPNSGETYNAMTKQWEKQAMPKDFAMAAHHWHQSGAALIGGCCRIDPKDIRSLSKRLKLSA